MKDPFEDTRTDSSTALLALIGVVVGALVLSSVNSVAFGVVLTLLAIIVVVMLHEAGHFLVGKRAGMKCTEYFVGFGPRIWSFRRGETEYGIKGILLGGYVRVIGMNNLEEVDPEDEPRTYRQAPFRWRLALALAGVTVNLIVCFVLVFAVFWGQGKADATTRIDAVTKPGAAFDAGLGRGDEVLALDDRSVRNDWDALTAYIRARPGETVDFTVLRRGEQLHIAVKLATKNPEGKNVGFAGLAPTTRYARQGPIAAVGDTGSLMWDATKETVAGFGRIFSPAGVERQVNAVAGKESADPAQTERPVGFIGILDLAGHLFAEGGFWSLLWFIGFFNLILAIFNLIPLLPFDGGHVAIACYEKVASTVTRRRVQVDIRHLLPLTVVVAVFLGFLVITSSYLDIRHLFD